MFDGVRSSETTYVSPTEIRCVAPAHDPGAVVIDVRVAADGGSRSTGSARFRYTATPGAISLSPSTGPARGGTIVQVGGYHFPSTDRLACRFGTGSTATHVPARWVSPTRLECRSPPASGADPAAKAGGGGTGVDVDVEVDAVEVAISVNGVDWIPTGLPFTYEGALVLGSITPEQGRSFGGHQLTLTGSGKLAVA